MIKFSKGDKARVISVDDWDVKSGVKVGDIVTVNQDDSCAPYCVLSNGRDHVFAQSQIEHYIETPKEITLNGATDVLKEKPKPEHEWKFGDIAVHDGKEYFFIKKYGEGDSKSSGLNPTHFKVIDLETLNIKSIPFMHTKFIRRADLSV